MHDAAGSKRRARRCSSRTPRRSWSTRATIAISWRRKSTSSPKWSATRWRTISTWPPSGSRLPVDLPFDFRDARAAVDLGLRHGLSMPAWSPNTGSSGSPGCRSRSISRPNSATARRRCEPGGLAIFVSQSGETADTLATLRYAKEQRPARARGRQRADLDHRARKRCGDADARRSGNRRRLDQGVHLPARGAGLPRDCGRPRARRAVARTTRRKLVRALIEVPRPDGRGAEARAADRAHGARPREEPATCSISAAAPAYPLALEGALKLKEISYIHAEGYAAGELKHGPIALIDETMPVIVIAPHDRVFEKTVSNMQEVAARGGRIILITDPAGAAASRTSNRCDQDHAAGDARDRDAAGLCDPGAAARLSHGGGHGHRRRSAAQSRQVGHGGVAVRRPFGGLGRAGDFAKRQQSAKTAWSDRWNHLLRQRIDISHEIRGSPKSLPNMR